MEEEHLRVLEQLGFDIKNKTYQDVVGELIEQHIQIMMEIESSNIELFKKEVKRVVNYPHLKIVGLKENLNED